jgi:hypothetical protein
MVHNRGHKSRLFDSDLTRLNEVHSTHLFSFMVRFACYLQGKERRPYAEVISVRLFVCYLGTTPKQLGTFSGLEHFH